MTRATLVTHLGSGAGALASGTFYALVGLEEFSGLAVVTRAGSHKLQKTPSFVKGKFLTKFHQEGAPFGNLCCCLLGPGFDNTIGDSQLPGQGFQFVEFLDRQGERLNNFFAFFRTGSFQIRRLAS